MKREADKDEQVFVEQESGRNAQARFIGREPFFYFVQISRCSIGFATGHKAAKGAHNGEPTMSIVPCAFMMKHPWLTLATSFHCMLGYENYQTILSVAHILREGRQDVHFYEIIGNVGSSVRRFL